MRTWKRIVTATVVLATAILAEPVDAQPGAGGEFQVGVTTLDDVVRRLGQPTMVQATSDGRRAIVYSRTKTRVKGATFVPVVGLFAGGAKASVWVQGFVFGPDGKLVSTYESDSQVKCSVSGNCSGGLPAADLAAPP
jgi:hypothetical protein